jgi:hypothetical protein
MPRLLALAFTATLTLPACAVEDSPDDADATAVNGGKADGTEFSQCELDAVVELLNSKRPNVVELEDAGVHALAAENIDAFLAGDDGEHGTDDDRSFADITAVDDVPYVGPVAMRQLVALVADDCAIDPWADAKNVDLELVVFPADMAAPDSYDYPRADGFRLSGTEFWQKWPDGHNPTYSYSEGTDVGRRCMQASALRFEAIMADPPPAIVALRDDTNWGGSFFNWNDDYSMSSWSDGSGASLWAWRTSLIKWISQTNRDGSCFLPTRELVERAAAECAETAEADGNGEIQGCSAG